MLDRAVAIDPNLGSVYVSYGVHDQLQGLLEEAFAQYHKALRLGANEVASMGLKQVKMELQYRGEDVEEMERVEREKK